jgi:hypothetical protein
MIDRKIVTMLRYIPYTVSYLKIHVFRNPDLGLFQKLNIIPIIAQETLCVAYIISVYHVIFSSIPYIVRFHDFGVFFLTVGEKSFVTKFLRHNFVNHEFCGYFLLQNSPGVKLS